MRNRTLAALAALALAAFGVFAASPAGPYRRARPGYRFEFPRDHFDHPDFETEWWYYTANLRAANGRRLGFELTFFRQAATRSLPADDSPWAVRDLYLAHFAVSDLDNGRFLHEERVNRAGPGLAGVDGGAGTIWNGNWSARLLSGPGASALQRASAAPASVRLRAVADAFDIDLSLESAKPPVIHGVRGVSQKSEDGADASHYVSLTRLHASGEVGLDGKRLAVAGSAWMDHEFFTSGPGSRLRGWDWTGLQLDDGTEVMVYRLRRTDGRLDRFSAATLASSDGASTHLESAEFAMAPSGSTWTSRETGAVYPISWHLSIPSRALELDIATPLASQEIPGRGLTPTYWEGAVTATGMRRGARLSGVGYLEMTGYDRAVVLGGSR